MRCTLEKYSVQRLDNYYNKDMCYCALWLLRYLQFTLGKLPHPVLRIIHYIIFYPNVVVHWKVSHSNFSTWHQTIARRHIRYHYIRLLYRLTKTVTRLFANMVNACNQPYMHTACACAYRTSCQHRLDGYHLYTTTTAAY